MADYRGAPRLFAGVELGGTKCVCILATGPDDIRDREVIPTTTPWETLPAIQRVLEDWTRAHGFRGLGIASFGPITVDPRAADYGRVGATNKSDWEGADLLGPLKSAFPVPTGFDTDVNGAALAEIRWGSGRGLDDFAYVTVGTGVGVGLIVHGRPTRGFSHSEIGHILVPRLAGDGTPSVCRFHEDCVEGLASGTALNARLNGRPLADVATDDPVWEPIVHTLASMVHALACTTGPMRVAMGGGVLAGQPQLLPRINAKLEASLAGYMRVPGDGAYVIAPELGTMAGPLGAIALAMDCVDAA
ncbi:ROK family protein [Sphingomonas sp. BT-65]|uniref:ROK family protein n=1 Tax=Sphingomonas sp. BT-65 TaxID=2989821 RepID=UPI00223595D3|nr:ROK family protein [Sphingomonas sp. BT-65]MCW4463829.1 ROK family protein [Sphingomonas sp. BT-65]